MSPSTKPSKTAFATLPTPDWSGNKPLGMRPALISALSNSSVNAAIFLEFSSIGERSRVWSLMSQGTMYLILSGVQGM